VASQASATDRDTLLCIQTYNDGVELWDLAADDVAVQERMPGLQQVHALSEGCAALANGKVILLHRHGPSSPLGLDGAASAVGSGARRVLVAAGTRVSTFTPDGALIASHLVGARVTAVTQLPPAGGDHCGEAASIAGQGQQLAVGFSNGNVELRSAKGAGAGTRPTLTLEETPASAPLRVLAGPHGTVIVGYASGVLGIWSQRDGSRLGHASLHGQVVHLLLRNQRLYAATDLGQHLQWDLAPFYRQHCDLLRDLWSHVPVVWEDGRAAPRSPPDAHACHQR
jgi:hypothetical protein